MPDRHQQTERATPRRRQQAREKGQVARSRELVSLASLGGIVLVLQFFGTRSVTRMASLTGDLLSMRYGRDPSLAMRMATGEAFFVLLPFFAAGAALAIAASVAQGGMVLKPFELQFSRLNPVEGIKRLFSINNLAETGKNLLKVAVGGLVVWRAVRGEIEDLPSLMAMDFPTMMKTAGGMVMTAVIYGFSCFFVLGICDFFLERWRFEKSIRMSKEEVKDEFKETEGNPQVKGRIRGIMRDLARRRMMAEVPKATVVVTNPVHLAVALRYDADGMHAPRIVAKGAGAVSEKIREIARRNGVPIVEDKPLARTLFKIDIGSFVPEDLYRAVAKILAQILFRAGRTS